MEVDRSGAVFAFGTGNAKDDVARLLLRGDPGCASLHYGRKCSETRCFFNEKVVHMVLRVGSASAVDLQRSACNVRLPSEVHNELLGFWRFNSLRNEARQILEVGEVPLLVVMYVFYDTAPERGNILRWFAPNLYNKDMFLSRKRIAHRRKNTRSAVRSASDKTWRVGSGSIRALERRRESACA